MTAYTDKELIELAEKNGIHLYGTTDFKRQLLHHPKVITAFENMQTTDVEN